MADSQSATGELTLSVILPNYNHGRYLPRALDALLAQDRPADEIIVVDDGSTDDSLDVIARYGAKSPSIRLLKNEKNIGVIATLTRGLQAARGRYVYFGAADDFVMPGFFSTAVAALQANRQAGMVCGEMILVDGNSGQSLGARPPVRPSLRAAYIPPAEFTRLLRYSDNFILTGAALLRRDAVMQAGGFDERLSTFADGYLVRKIAFTHGLYYLPRACLTWNIFPDSVSRTTSTDLDRAKAVFGAIESQMATDPVFPKWYPGVFAQRWRFSLCRLAVQAEPVDVGVLMQMGIQSETDRVLFEWVLGKFSGRAARLIILAWLWLRLRPFSLTGLVSTALARRWSTVAKG
jgi:glycosyltransferase involved in cell wall biosynthesis